MITLNSSYIAVKNLEQNGSDVMQGTVSFFDSALTTMEEGDVILFPRSDGKAIMHENKEYIVVQASNVIGKL